MIAAGCRCTRRSESGKPTQIQSRSGGRLLLTRGLSRAFKAYEATRGQPTSQYSAAGVGAAFRIWHIASHSSQPMAENTACQASPRLSPHFRTRGFADGCLGIAASTTAEASAGTADVIDADTLDIQGERIRLLNVDAPETDQTCQRPNGSAWPCGQQAMSKLAGWIGHCIVTCQTERKDRYGRWLAQCEAGGEDMGQWLASRGWAVPYRDCKCESIRAASEYARGGSQRPLERHLRHALRMAKNVITSGTRLAFL